jgi:ring-1,2-phenylacetyl-CoA epoxidase subunit PaaC
MKDELSTENSRSSVLSPQESALAELLLALADDEFVTGYANSEWTGIAPVLEEDIAFSSLAQDELGHARLFYELLANVLALGNRPAKLGDAEPPTPSTQPATPDQIAYRRPASGFHHAQLVERPRGDWAYSVSRQFLYDTADYVRLDSLRQSAYAPLAEAAASIIREAKYHLLHAQTWLERLASGSAEARRRQRLAFDALWPDALGLFEPLAGEAELVEAKILPATFAALQQRWLASVAAPLCRLALPFPFAERDGQWVALIEPLYGGRHGQHSEHFGELYENITHVYQLDPNAQW